MTVLHRIKEMYFPTLAERLGYSRKDILVIVNIDDMGLHKDETEASFRSLNFGIVKSGSIMVPCPNYYHTIELWKEKPEYELGIHLTLTCEWGNKYPWSPVLAKAKVPSLYNPEGIMWAKVRQLFRHARREEIAMELDAQINKVLDTGLKPTHLDYHADFAYSPDIFPIVLELSRKYDLPLRAPKRRRYLFPFYNNSLWSLRRRGYTFPDTQMGIYMMKGPSQSFDYRRAKYFEHLRLLKPGVHAIKTHMAFQTEELQTITGKRDSSIRKIDYDIWSSSDTKKFAEELGIIFIGFRPLQRLQEELMNKRAKA